MCTHDRHIRRKQPPHQHSLLEPYSFSANITDLVPRWRRVIFGILAIHNSPWYDSRHRIADLNYLHTLIEHHMEREYFAECLCWYQAFCVVAIARKWSVCAAVSRGYARKKESKNDMKYYKNSVISFHTNAIVIIAKTRRQQHSKRQSTPTIEKFVFGIVFNGETFDKHLMVENKYGKSAWSNQCDCLPRATRTNLAGNINMHK